MPNHRYHQEWKLISRYIRELFQYYCARCGKNCKDHDHTQDQLQVHHIDENPANNEITNLIPLCAKCHLQIEKEARQHAPFEEQLELFHQTYFTAMSKLRETALQKYSCSTTSKKASLLSDEEYEMQEFDWEQEMQ